MQRTLRTVGAPIIILLTIAAFAYYLSRHTYLLHQLARTSPLVVVWLILLWVICFVALAMVLHFSLKMFRKNLATGEALLLNSYATLLNFFGPGQSGPAVRGAYLKKKHGLRVRDYVFGTLIYYAMYAVISALMLFGGSRPWWQTVVLVGAVAGFSAFVIRRFARRRKNDEAGKPLLTPLILGGILFGTVLQAVGQVLIYFVELHAVSSHIAWSQVISYTGAANFSLFVSLTPGAIGIRESFLIFSQHLHHIGNGAIVAANLLDRAVYLIFLGLLFVLVLAMHAKDKFQVRQARKES